MTNPDRLTGGGALFGALHSLRCQECLHIPDVGQFFIMAIAGEL
jgi:hypothetical protein